MSNSASPVKVVAVTDTEDFFQGLYVDGKLVGHDSTIYAADIAHHTKGMVIEFSHVMVAMPEGADNFPATWEECESWIDTEYEALVE